eukprot:GHRR01012168.1.p2 GENE.GHRR01012168.1~~GHRR01012168.1.p2  ORF type:complete len:166 (-),score=14.90 GHRR01012168.1:2427-2924(-)
MPPSCRSADGLIRLLSFVSLCEPYQPCALPYAVCFVLPQRRLSRPGVLIPAHLSNRDPSYFLVSGLVFTVACEPYLESEYGADWMSEAPVKLLDRLYTGMPSAAGEQVVVLGQVLADEATLGYEDICNVQVSCCTCALLSAVCKVGTLCTLCNMQFKSGYPWLAM